MLTADEIRDVNTRYHDVAADSYDSKWGIDFGEIGQAQVLGKLRKLLGAELDRGYDRSLEIGAGTGYFSLNLLQAGVVSEATCTDISPGMLSTPGGATRSGSASRSRPRAPTPSRCRSPTRALTSCSAMPSFTTCPTCAAPSPSFTACCGRGAGSCSPASRRGSGTGSPPFPSAGPTRLAPAWRRLLRARPAGGGADDGSAHNGSGGRNDHDLERFVDIHAFEPGDLSRHARRAGFSDVRVRGEELAANWFGWFNRALEASADPTDVPMLWRQYAFHGYLALQRLDERLLEPVLPPAIFYNLLLTARRG